MGLGQQSCYLKTPLQTFDTPTAVALIASHFRIISVDATDFWGGVGKGGCKIGVKDLIFKLKRTE